MNRQNLINRLVARKLQPAAKKALCWIPPSQAKALCVVCIGNGNARSLCFSTGTNK